MGLTRPATIASRSSSLPDNDSLHDEAFLDAELDRVDPGPVVSLIAVEAADAGVGAGGTGPRRQHGKPVCSSLTFVLVILPERGTNDGTGVFSAQTRPWRARDER